MRRNLLVTVGLLVASLLTAVPVQAAGSLVINEIYYNPPDANDGDEEFLELHNPGNAAFDLSGMCFVGFTLCFAPGTKLAAGGYGIVSPDADLAVSVHGVIPLAEFADGGLAGSGELIQLIAADGTTVVDEVEFADDSPWPKSPDGDGPSLELIDPASDNSVASSWKASQVDAGTPGAVNSVSGSVPPVPITRVKITPADPSASDRVVVTAKMPVGLSPKLTYKVMFGSDRTIAMDDDGASGDGAANDGLYGATIPRQRKGDLVRYRIDVTSGGEGAFPAVDDTINYVGYVVEDTDITTTTEVFQWFLPDGKYDDMMANHRHDDVKVPGVLAANGVVYDNVTFRIRGGSGTRSQPKVPFQVEMPNGHLFSHPELANPVDQFNLQAETHKDRTRSRAWLGWMQWEAAGHPKVDQFWVRLERNRNFEGLYRFSETLDGDWRRREGFNDGSFYKAAGSSGFEKESPKDGGTSEVDRFWDRLADSSSSAKSRYMYDNINIPAAINWTALTALTRHWDSMASNFYLDRDGDTERWTVVGWDLDLTYTDYGETCGSSRMISVECTDNDLAEALMRDPDFYEMHLRRLRTLADELLFSSFIDRRYESLQAEIADVVALDAAKWDATLTMGYLDDVERRRRRIRDAITAGEIPGRQAAKPPVVINELHYNPADGGVEFLELFNPGSKAVDLSGWSIPGADLLIAPGTVLLPKSYVVFTEDDAALRAQSRSGIFIGGEYDGGLAGGGELVELRDADGVVIDVVEYDDEKGWPTTPDGDGPSLELIDSEVDNSLPNAWAPSRANGGSPGEANDPNTSGLPPPPPPPHEVSYVSFGDRWRFLDDGSNQRTAWRQPGFDASSWSRGPAELGYGDGDESTVVAAGPSGNRHITTYFRSAFAVKDPALVLELSGRLVRDDGAVVYINGVEVYRTNLGSGTIRFDTTATTTVRGSSETRPVSFAVSPDVLVRGANTVAVEIHQRNRVSSDISFDLELVGTAHPRFFCNGKMATIVGTPGNDVLVGTSGDDVIVGLGGNDVIVGKWGNDTLCGNSGWDKISPGRGVDYVNGGRGARDWVSYSSAGRGVAVSLHDRVAAGQGRDTLVRIENIIGSRFGDALVGNAYTNRIIGGAGADSLWGRLGDDLLWGNRGPDTISGGQGYDVAKAGPGADTCSAEVKVSC